MLTATTFWPASFAATMYWYDETMALSDMSPGDAPSTEHLRAMILVLCATPAMPSSLLDWAAMMPAQCVPWEAAAAS